MSKLSGVIRTVVIIAILISSISCDQITKSIVRSQVSSDEQISMFNNSVTLMRVENSGAFLSLGHALPSLVKQAILILIPVLVLLAGIYFVFNRKDIQSTTLIGICFVLGGGIGNIYDRIIYGSVTDFLHINFGLFETGIFNLADVSIMVGIFIVIFDTYRTKTLVESN
ncbi:signal peptidase II [Pseudochryseolinea flava]|uniref:Lipoprotein signal peptidase n=1 Tax=Pseudochryseolinea flava TaxID=2059302 RepID=A0A364Y3E0_9BACT|nr:signal peptidase II [Pseudochryseolinea flava]RAW01395.1 signal peptidase II [Pseudochryseolinea flava]